MPIRRIVAGTSTSPPRFSQGAYLQGILAAVGKRLHPRAPGQAVRVTSRSSSSPPGQPRELRHERQNGLLDKHASNRLHRRVAGTCGAVGAAGVRQRSPINDLTLTLPGCECSVFRFARCWQTGPACRPLPAILGAVWTTSEEETLRGPNPLPRTTHRANDRHSGAERCALVCTWHVPASPRFPTRRLHANRRR
jgi:hypothetical protein